MRDRWKSWFALVTEGPRACEQVLVGLLERASGPALVIASIAASFSFTQLGRIGSAIDIAAKLKDVHRLLG